MRSVMCSKCKTVITSSASHIVGCSCDPDAPTWIALNGDRLMAGSHAQYETAP